MKKNFHLELQTFKEALSELEYDEEITNKGKDGKISYFLKENASDNESIYSESSLADITLSLSENSFTDMSQVFSQSMSDTMTQNNDGFLNIEDFNFNFNSLNKTNKATMTEINDSRTLFYERIIIMLKSQINDIFL